MENNYDMDIQAAATEALLGSKPEKVSEKWFKENGWIIDRDVNVEAGGTVRKSLRCTIYNGKLHARYDRVIYIYQPAYKGDTKHISRFYTFYAHNKKNNFEVSNRISHSNFTIAQIQAALLITGFYDK